jgi:hypothetical protein
MLPVDLTLDGVKILWSTAEIADRHADGVILRLTGDADAIALATDRTVAPGEGFVVETRDGGVLVTSTIRGTGEEMLRLRWS